MYLEVTFYVYFHEMDLLELQYICLVVCPILQVRQVDLFTAVPEGLILSIPLNWYS